MKIFSLEFLCYPGLDVQCQLCEEPIKDRQEEVIIPVLYLNKTYQGPICEACYKDLPGRINASRLQKFAG